MANKTQDNVNNPTDIKNIHNSLVLSFISKLYIFYRPNYFNFIITETFQLYLQAKDTRSRSEELYKLNYFCQEGATVVCCTHIRSHSLLLLLIYGMYRCKRLSTELNSLKVTLYRFLIDGYSQRVLLLCRFLFLQ